jgi:hypothetical protein
LAAESSNHNRAVQEFLLLPEHALRTNNLTLSVSPGENGSHFGTDPSRFPVPLEHSLLTVKACCALAGRKFRNGRTASARAAGKEAKRRSGGQDSLTKNDALLNGVCSSSR